MQPDLNQMMRDVQKMQQAMLKLQDDLAKADVVGTAGGGVVKISCTGALEFSSVKIQPEALDPNDVETLEDLVLVAIKDACQKAKDLSQQKLGQSGINLPPGFSP